MSKKKVVSYTNGSESSKRIIWLTALNDEQKEAIKTFSDPDNVITILNGPAGSGKTFMAVSWGLEQLRKGNFEKLIFSRPVVEAGESLGFLPGSFADKLSPFMIPIFDTLGDHLSVDEIKKLVEANKIITLPLAYMRGCTFKNAFVLLDEAQNATGKQLHLFLTRVGKNAKVIITGDNSQSDINGNNGLKDAMFRLKDIPGLAIVELTSNSIVRHPIIAEIDKRYQLKI